MSYRGLTHSENRAPSIAPHVAYSCPHHRRRADKNEGEIVGEEDGQKQKCAEILVPEHGGRPSGFRPTLPQRSFLD